MAVTEQQVRVYMSEKTKGHTQTISAAKAGFSERTARRVERRGGISRGGKGRHWRTRSDPFEEVWEPELLPQLEGCPQLNAVTLLEELQRRYPDHYPDKLLRTLQRRVKQWRALQGPEKEVMFRQSHPPGELGLSDFTELKGVEVTVEGQRLSHRLYHFRLAYSGWSDVKVILGGESFTALAEGLSRALTRLAGCPREHRTDSLSAAFKNLGTEAAADITERYAALCEHYGMRPSRNNPGRGHENGAIESPHGHLKRRIRQALMLRGDSDFDSVDAYQVFIDTVVDQHNRRNQATLSKERPHLLVLPKTRPIDYTELFVRVTTSSTIAVRLVVYTVPSRLIGERLRVHLYDDRVDCFLRLTSVLTLSRVYPKKGKRRARCIDYRHVIGSLKRKPMAFYRCQLRDDLLPNDSYRQIWEAIDNRLAPRAACKLMVGVLVLAAEQDCEGPLAEYIQGRLDEHLPSLVELQRRFGAPSRSLPVLSTEQHDLSAYDALLMNASSPSLNRPALTHG